MSVLDSAHDKVFDRRVQVLAAHLADLVGKNAKVLDVGCGDGTIAHLLMQHRPDLKVEGVDVLVRPETRIPVRGYDGKKLPYKDNAFDEVTIIDVVHHADNPALLVSELARVAKNAVIIKDHNLKGLAAFSTLCFMDWVGNDRHGVVLPYTYWPEERWDRVFAEAGLTRTEYRRQVGLYPFWADWLFGRGLHFVARLEKS